MKRFLKLGATVALLAILCLAGVRAQEKQPDKLREAWARMARVQALLEYYFMESGEYPPSLAALDKALNAQKPNGVPGVEIPVDPGTNQPFVYKVDPQTKRYALSIPDPSAYGGERFTLPSVDWGYLALVAEQRRYEQLALECGFNIKTLATRAELFAKDHEKKFPKSLDEMFPKYISRYPQCPASGKNLVLTPTANGYVISCPNPERHGLKLFRYNSSQGMQVEELHPSRPDKPGGNGQNPGGKPPAESSPPPPEDK